MRNWRKSTTKAPAVASVPVILLALALVAFWPGRARALSEGRKLPQWETDLEKHSVPLEEIRSGGPGKDGIPAIDEPQFVPVEGVGDWLGPKEPVISLAVEDDARAYPLQILIWHEIVNDRVGGVPVAVTFCPLCHTGLVFDRRLEGGTTTFGVSGFLRHSDLVMYDRRTESWWQQATGTAIVGELTGRTLERLPAQIISFRQFARAHPDGRVLSRETGYERPYGRNPYVGYDEITNRPWGLRGEADDRLPPMARVVTVKVGDEVVGYPYSVTRRERVIHDEVGGRPIAVFHAPGARSALDAGRLRNSREVGSTGVFDRRLGERALRFRYREGEFVDAQTGSAWDVTGRAVRGPLKGRRLEPVVHGDYFAFAWLAFRPEARIYARDAE